MSSSVKLACLAQEGLITSSHRSQKNNSAIARRLRACDVDCGLFDRFGNLDTDQLRKENNAKVSRKTPKPNLYRNCLPYSNLIDLVASARRA